MHSLIYRKRTFFKEKILFPVTTILIWENVLSSTGLKLNEHTIQIFVKMIATAKREK